MRIATCLCLAGLSIVIWAGPTRSADLSGYGDLESRNGTPAPAPVLSGWYVGGRTGVSNYWLDGTVETFPTKSYPNRIAGKSTNLNHHKSVWTLGAFAGYGHYIGNWFVGGEVDLSFYPSKINKRIKLADHTVQIENSLKVSLSALAGHRFGDGLIYGRLGLAYTDVDVAVLENAFVHSQPNSKHWGAVHDWLGATVGIGYAHPLTEHLSWRADYTFTYYLDGPRYNNDKNDGEKYDLNLNDNRFSFGLAWSF